MQGFLRLTCKTWRHTVKTKKIPIKITLGTSHKVFLSNIPKRYQSKNTTVSSLSNALSEVTYASMCVHGSWLHVRSCEHICKVPRSRMVCPFVQCLVLLPVWLDTVMATFLFNTSWISSSELVWKWVLGSNLYATVIFLVLCGVWKTLLNNGHRRSSKVMASRRVSQWGQHSDSQR